jgi:hypothetical protein
MGWYMSHYSLWNQEQWWQPWEPPGTAQNFLAAWVDIGTLGHLKTNSSNPCKKWTLSMFSISWVPPGHGIPSSRDEQPSGIDFRPFFQVLTLYKTARYWWRTTVQNVTFRWRKTSCSSFSAFGGYPSLDFIAWLVIKSIFQRAGSIPTEAEHKYQTVRKRLVWILLSSMSLSQQKLAGFLHPKYWCLPYLARPLENNMVHIEI